MGKCWLYIPGGTLAGTALNLVRAAGVVVRVMVLCQCSLPAGNCLGMCQYNGTVYISLYTQGVHKLTNINWTADTLTYHKYFPLLLEP